MLDDKVIMDRLVARTEQVGYLEATLRTILDEIDQGADPSIQHTYAGKEIKKAAIEGLRWSEVRELKMPRYQREEP